MTVFRYKSTCKEDIEQQIHRTESNIENVKDVLRNIERDQVRCDELTALHQELAPHTNNTDLLEAIVSSYANEHAFTQDIINSRCNRNNAALEDYLNTHRALKKQLRELAPQADEGITQEQANAVAASNPAVSDVLVTTDTISWTFTGLKYRPLYNEYKFINNGDIPAIPLPKIVVTLNSKNLNAHNPLFIRQHRTDNSKLNPHYSQARTVHPHVLCGDTPCLGSFEMSLFDALDNNDIETIITIVQMFLETANPDDQAGATWVADVIDPADIFDSEDTGSTELNSDLYDYAGDRYLYGWRYIVKDDGTIAEISRDNDKNEEEETKEEEASPPVEIDSSNAPIPETRTITFNDRAVLGINRDNVVVEVYDLSHAWVDAVAPHSELAANSRIPITCCTCTPATYE